MNFLEMRQELSDRIPAYDYTTTDDATKLNRWLNMAQQYIAGKYLWPFTLAEEIVQTVTDITTGTATIAAQGTALTLSSGPSDSVQGRYIRLTDTSDDWYEITAHTAGATSATISPAYVGTSAYTAGTYVIRKLLYTTTTPLIKIIDMKQIESPSLILPINALNADFFLPLYLDTGDVHHYVISSPDSSGNPQFSLVNSPDSVLNIMVRGVQVLTDMSADSDTSVIPAPWHDAIVNIASYYGFRGVDDRMAIEELEIGENRIEDMKKNYAQDMGRHRVVQSVEEGIGSPMQYYVHGKMGSWRV